MMTTISRYTPPSTTNQQRSGIVFVGNKPVQDAIPGMLLSYDIACQIENYIPRKGLEILESLHRSRLLVSLRPPDKSRKNQFFVDIGEMIPRRFIPHWLGLRRYESRYSGTLDNFAQELRDGKWPHIYDPR
jgi:hypothetical protein